MGKVGFGVATVSDKEFVPIITIEQDDLTITFEADVALGTLDEARRFCLTMNKILTGPRHDFVYDREGKAL